MHIYGRKTFAFRCSIQFNLHRFKEGFTAIVYEEIQMREISKYTKIVHFFIALFLNYNNGSTFLNIDIKIMKIYNLY